MAGLISRRPFIGVAGGLIFGALGLLLTGMDRTPGTIKGVAGVLFKGVGYFLLFVAALSFIAAGIHFWNALRSRKNNNA